MGETSAPADRMTSPSLVVRSARTLQTPKSGFLEVATALRLVLHHALRPKRIQQERQDSRTLERAAVKDDAPADRRPLRMRAAAVIAIDVSAKAADRPIGRPASIPVRGGLFAEARAPGSQAWLDHLFVGEGRGEYRAAARGHSPLEEFQRRRRRDRGKPHGGLLVGRRVRCDLPRGASRSRRIFGL